MPMALTEAQWLECKSITLPVMRAMRKHGSDRKFYLAAAAALRQIEHLLTDPRSRAVIEVVERFADGQASLGELHAAHDQAVAADFIGPAMRATKEDMKRQYAGMAASYAATPPDQAFAPKNGPRGVWTGVYTAIDNATNAGNPRESRPRMAGLVRDILGNPFRRVTVDPAWKTGDVVALATAIYQERAFERMPILGDALEEAGCQERSVLDHCRQPGEHVRGCWVVDLLLGRL
jgi:hypothetical protein